MKKLIVFCMLIAGAMFFCFSACGESSETEQGTGTTESKHLTSTEDIGLYDVDGAQVTYAFTYKGEEFRAQYLYGTWTLYDSYKITDEDDMKIICQALIDTHPVYGSDYVSYREADDMVYEWKQHNLAYQVLPEDNAWRSSAMNVDFDPEDQGRSFKEIYEDRTGEKLDIKKLIKEGLEDGEVLESLKELLK